MKREALHRANYRCERCGERSKVWRYHHRDGDPSHNVPSNIKVLCPGCHDELHHKWRLRKIRKKEREKRRRKAPAWQSAEELLLGKRKKQ